MTKTRHRIQYHANPSPPDEDRRRRLKPGNDVTIDRADGLAVTSRVTRVPEYPEYPKVQFPTNEVYGSSDAAELRLITCGRRFDSNTHSYDDTIVAFAGMVGVA